MSTENKNVNVEEMVDNMPEPTMPAPKTMNYEQTVKFTDEFVRDMTNALNGFAYNEVAEIFKTVDKFKDAMPINLANEIIQRIASFPYYKVAQFMSVIENDQTRYIQLNNQNNA